MDIFSLKTIFKYFVMCFAVIMTACLLSSCEPEDPDDHYASVWNNLEINFNV